MRRRNDEERVGHHQAVALVGELDPVRRPGGEAEAPQQLPLAAALALALDGRARGPEAVEYCEPGIRRQAGAFRPLGVDPVVLAARHLEAADCRVRAPYAWLSSSSQSRNG